MGFLATIFFLVTVGVIVVLKDEIAPNEMTKQLYETSQTKYEPDKKKILKLICVLLLAVTLFVVCFVAGCNDDKKESEWGKLSKEEKQWYKDNYGDGQYDDYKKAMENYRGW